jgi:hypothetical protein
LSSGTSGSESSDRPVGSGPLPWLVSLALGALALVVVFETFSVRVPAEVSLNYGEGFVQLDAVRAARGEPLYGDPGTLPWTLHVYTPLYSWLVALLLLDGSSSYVPGRLIGYLSVLFTAALIVWSGRTRSGSVAWGVGALYLTLPLFIPWGAAVRPDNLAVAFSALGVVIVDRCAGRRSLYWAIPVFLAAGLTKQSVLAGLAAACVSLALRDKRIALRFSAVFATAMVAIVAGLELASDGGFWLHTVSAHLDKPFGWNRVGSVATAFGLSHAPLVLLAAALCIRLALTRRASIYGLWLVIAALTTITAGKSGSDTNYFLEAAAAAMFLAAQELSWPASSAPAWRRAVAAIAAGMAIVWAGLNVGLHERNGEWIAGSEAAFEAALIEWGRTPGPIVSDDAGFLLAANEPLYLRPYIMSELARSGDWDPAPLLEALRQREVGLLIVQREPEGIYHMRYTAEMRAAMERHYRRVGAYRLDFEYEIHTPRPTTRAPRR